MQSRQVASKFRIRARTRPSGRAMSQCSISKCCTHPLLRRRRYRRRNTVSHLEGCCLPRSSQSLDIPIVAPQAPPAPPSTPTSLTPTGLALSSVEHNVGDGDRLDSVLYILDYAPKFKKKLKEQQHTDNELAELFNVVSLSPNSKAHSRSMAVAAASGLLSNSAATYAATSKLKLEPERGVSALSRSIHKHQEAGTTKIFKVHRNIRELLHDTDEENSISAPEFETEEEDICFERVGRVRTSRLILAQKRRGHKPRFRCNQRLDSIINSFDMAMSFNDV